MTLSLRGIGYVTAAFVLAFALAPVDGARADPVTFDYVGADFTHANLPFAIGESVTGMVTFEGPLAANLNLAIEIPTVFSFTAGPETLTSANFSPSFTQFKISTDAAGDITGWVIGVGLGGGGNFTIWNNSAGGQLGDQAFVGANFTGPKDPSNASGGNLVAGQFTIAAAVPEPSTWAMMLLGFAGLGFMAYRRKQPLRVA
jgi:hypothetical protein